MRLFLTSAGVRGRVHELTELVGDGARVAVSANALDMEPPTSREHWLDVEMTTLADAGLRPFEVDLRGDGSSIDDADMLWATGGNVFVLRRALADSGADVLLQQRVRDDALAYGGSSAGACVCAPTLCGIELFDDPAAAGEPIFDGLGFVEFSIAPHAGTDEMDRLIEHFERTGMPYCALRDGEAIVVHGDDRATVECYRAVR